VSDREKMGLDLVKEALLNICNNPSEFAPREVARVSGDAHYRIEELERQLMRQRGKVDLASARRTASALAGASVVFPHDCRSAGFGSNTMRFLIEELEWRRQAMHDPNDGTLAGDKP
jgi:hypothetical protein